MWKGKFKERLENGYFNQFATYYLDSATTWTDAVMNHVQKEKKRVGQVPQWNTEYHPQKVYIRNYMKEILNLPCHVILPAHLEPQKDKEGNVVSWRVMFSGKGAITVPLLFSEIWVTDSKETREGMEYFIHLQRTGLYLARSRLAGRGKLEAKENHHLRTIFKKAGLDVSDKPKIFEGKEVNEVEEGT
jgi:hypothetical protein